MRTLDTSCVLADSDGVGDIAVNFSLSDQFGEAVELHDFCDRAVLIDSGAMC